MLAMLKLNQPALRKEDKEGREVCGEVTPRQERMGEVACSGIRIFIRIWK